MTGDDMPACTQTTWYEWLASQVRSAFGWLFADDDGDGMPNILEVAHTIVSVVSLFNSREPSDAEKREYARAVLSFSKHATVEQLERIVDIKRQGHLDSLESAQMDMALGTALSVHVHEKKGREVPEDAFDIFGPGGY